MMWEHDWAWSLPLIVANVIIHILGLMLIYAGVVRTMNIAVQHRKFQSAFLLVMSIAALLATLLHGFEAVTWAVAYKILDAMADNGSAMLYSVSAMTTYGHANIFLKEKWQLMGALEALDGMLLFGLTTAFLFAMIQKVWTLESRNRDEHGSYLDSRLHSDLRSSLLLRLRQLRYFSGYRSET